ncbi:hypothetical protein BJ508DRAFT_332843 [Ascobolus immersus RN42]|uniref:Uncharacterized protein n=1 Tax=Ascobolus immersus RN42 TaxID=1160509 RepID=A0A3N4HP09_ASCIM|nr:hypothetical protein BJ508DRAFT_332843 [Ascobolus immersus RN42]
MKPTTPDNTPRNKKRHNTEHTRGPTGKKTRSSFKCPTTLFQCPSTGSTSSPPPTQPLSAAKQTTDNIVAQGSMDVTFHKDDNVLKGHRVFLPRRGKKQTYFLRCAKDQKGRDTLLLICEKVVDGKKVEMVGGTVMSENRRFGPLVDMVKAGMYVIGIVEWWRKYKSMRGGGVCWDGALFWDGFISKEDCRLEKAEYSDGHDDSEYGTDHEV